MSEDDKLTQAERERLAEFGDDGGPEPAEGEGAARDGEPSKPDLKTIPGGKGTPLADRPETETEEEDGQAAFVVEEAGKTVTLAQLVKRGVDTEVRYSMTGKSIGNVKAGLLDPFATSVKIASDCVVDSINHQYVRDGDGKVEKVIQYVTLKPRIVHPAKSEAGRLMLGMPVEAKAS